MSVDVNEYKRLAAIQAVEQIRSGMIIGLGTGTTAIFATRRIAELLHSGALKGILGIPTSSQTEAEAIRLQIPLTTLAEHREIDLTIDGADEIAPNLDVIKGGGGALLREKIVAQASRQMLVVGDESKLSEKLGTHFKLPVEVVPFGWQSQARYLESLGGKVILRLGKDGAPYKTDQGNHILDCDFGPMDDPVTLGARIRARAGIVEHGLFLGLVSQVIVAGPGGIRTIPTA